MERIYFDMWLCAGRTEQIPEAGSYFVRRIGNASVIILRDASGKVHAHHNVCRHRGTMLCGDTEGRFAGRIQCQYHAWTYGLDGALVNAPHMDKVEGFREADYPLRKVAVDTWDGHIFINLSERPTPFADHVVGLPAKFRPWGMEDLRLVERRVYPLKANWKLIIQNYSECLHCPIVHPLLQKQSHYMSGDNEPAQPTYLGGRMDLREGVKTLSMDGTTNRACLPGLDAADQRRVYYYAVLPNLLLNLHPDFMLTFTLWPLAPDRTDIVCEWHFHPDAIAAPTSIRAAPSSSGTSPTARTGISRSWRSRGSRPAGTSRDRTRTARSCCTGSTASCRRGSAPAASRGRRARPFKPLNGRFSGTPAGAPR